VTDTSRHRERAWAFTHGELDETDARDFSRQLQSDTALADEVRKIQQADRTLRELLPVQAQSRAEIADAIEKELDRDLEQRVVRGPWRQPDRSRFGLNGPWMAGLLAVAAGVLILIGMPSLFPGHAVHWDKPQYTLLQYRGTDSGLGRDGARRCFEALVTGMDRSLRNRYDLTKAERDTVKLWQLAFALKEQPGGGFSARVSATHRRSGATQTWRADCPGVDAWSYTIGVLAEEIADWLVRHERGELQATPNAVEQTLQTGGTVAPASRR
jgi:hypothetical protein